MLFYELEYKDAKVELEVDKRDITQFVEIQEYIYEAPKYKFQEIKDFLEMVPIVKILKVEYKKNKSQVLNPKKKKGKGQKKGQKKN